MLFKANRNFSCIVLKMNEVLLCIFLICTNKEFCEPVLKTASHDAVGFQGLWE
jgi:hypothetical protein